MQISAGFFSFAVQKDSTGVHDGVNIEEEASTIVEARTCGEKNRRVAYKFMDGFHSLCLDKKDIVLAEIDACEVLLRACNDQGDRNAIEKEISELKLVLDLMS
ncbi:MAG TPA: hypothetical protein VIB07_04865 [Nitrososphaera sp.]|jgi:hypothetical protein